MKLTILGATGEVGQNLVQQTLALGHKVTAFTRSPDKLKSRHDNLKVVAGDVLDPEAVKDSVQGQDAVLCALGMPLMNKDQLRSKGTANIVQAMEETGVKRLVCLSVLGAGDSRSVLPFHYTYLIVPFLLRRTIADHNKQETHIRNSGLDWVMVRPGNFTDGSKTGSYRHGFTAGDPPASLKISRADVADFMIRQLADNAYLHQAPSLSY